MVLGFSPSGAIILAVKNSPSKTAMSASALGMKLRRSPRFHRDDSAPRKTLGVSLGGALLLASGMVFGQGLGAGFNSVSEAFGADSSTEITSFKVAPASVLSSPVPAFSISRQLNDSGLDGDLVEDALSYQLGVSAEPAQGLSVSADAWRLSVNDSPANAGLSAALASSAASQNTVAQPFSIDDSALNEFDIDGTLLGSSLETNGFDLSATYAWDTSRFGQFTLSTTSSYVQNFENRSPLMELGRDEIGSLGSMDERIVSPELQSSMMLSWELGNHTASAITNYFNSFKDISEIDIDEINDLVDSITTFDLQYGYSVKTGSKDRAIISFGIRNLFDEKTAQILNSSTRLVDQNGRVAYGSIKYQF